jgi:hypothetical protein
MKKIITCFVAFAVLMAGLIPVAAGSSDAVMAVVSQAAGETAVDMNGPDGSSAKVTKEQAKQIAAKVLKDYFEIRADDKNYQVNIQFSRDMTYNPFGYDPGSASYVWNLNYQFNSANMSYTSAMVSVDSVSGKVIRINKFEGSYNQTQQPVAVYTKEEAKKTGEAFLNRINPDEMKQAVYLDLDSMYKTYGGYKGATYSFSYFRQVNGIPFENDSIMVSVDGVTGKITMYSYAWNSDRSFPSAGSAMNKESAAAILKGNMKLNLNYIPSITNYSYNIEPKAAKLVYSLDPTASTVIDSAAGTAVNPGYITGETPKTKDMSDKEKSDFNSRYKPVSKLSSELDSSKAQGIMQDKLKEILGDEYTVDNLNYQDNGTNWGGGSYKCWNAMFYKKGSIPSYGPPAGNIVINAETGELVSMYKQDFMENQETGEFEPKITWEAAYYKALDIIAANFPDKVRDIKTEQQYFKQNNIINGVKMPERYYSFNFVRTVNGIPCQGNSINITFDIKTGLVNQLNCPWYDSMTFSDPDKAISNESALKTYFDAHAPELAYISVADSVYGKDPLNNIKLVYRLKTKVPYMPDYLDAVSGKWINAMGQDLDEANRENSFAELIKGSWAEKELGILAFQGIIDIGSFKPDKAVTRLEAIKMLVNAKGFMYYMNNAGVELKFKNIVKDTEEYRYLQMAVSYGIIDNKDGEFESDGKVTREEMAEMIVKLVKYDKLAGARDIFSLSFTDANEISPEKYGFVAIGKGLGMFVGDNGKFRPMDYATMAEMAVAIYKGIGNIQTVSGN